MGVAWSLSRGLCNYLTSQLVLWMLHVVKRAWISPWDILECWHLHDGVSKEQLAYTALQGQQGENAKLELGKTKRSKGPRNHSALVGYIMR